MPEGSRNNQDHQSHPSEILLTPRKPKIWARVHITLQTQLASERFRATEEHPCLCGSVDLADPFENGVPVWPSEVRRRTKARDRISLGAGVVDHDVLGVVRLDFGGQILPSMSATGM